MDLTPKQQQVYNALRDLDGPLTVRSLADQLETQYHRAERWSDDEIRGLLERLERKGYVEQAAGPSGEQVYRPAGDGQ